MEAQEEQLPDSPGARLGNVGWHASSGTCGEGGGRWTRHQADSEIVSEDLANAPAMRPQPPPGSLAAEEHARLCTLRPLPGAPHQWCQWPPHLPAGRHQTLPPQQWPQQPRRRQRAGPCCLQAQAISGSRRWGTGSAAAAIIAHAQCGQGRNQLEQTWHPSYAPAGPAGAASTAAGAAGLAASTTTGAGLGASTTTGAALGSSIASGAMTARSACKRHTACHVNTSNSIQSS